MDLGLKYYLPYRNKMVELMVESICILVGEDALSSMRRPQAATNFPISD